MWTFLTSSLRFKICNSCILCAQSSLVSHFNALFLQMLSNCLMRLGAKLKATALCISVDLAIKGSLGISNKFEFALP